MDFTLTYDKLMKFPDDFLNEAKNYYDSSELLSKHTYEGYDLKELREKIEAKFEKFKDAKYIYKYPAETRIRTTPTYQPREGFVPRSNTSQQEKIVTKMGDSLIWVEQFYDTFMEAVARKLTEQEAVYLMDSFFKHRSEDDIADKLSICKVTLQKIKKSCLVKVWIELETLENFED